MASWVPSAHFATATVLFTLWGSWSDIVPRRFFFLAGTTPFSADAPPPPHDFLALLGSKVFLSKRRGLVGSIICAVSKSINVWYLNFLKPLSALDFWRLQLLQSSESVPNNQTIFLMNILDMNHGEDSGKIVPA